MHGTAKVPHFHVNRRTFLKGAAAAAAGSAVALGTPGTALAGGGTSGGSHRDLVFTNNSLPNPIPATVGTAEPGFDPPPNFDFIHWLLPGPPGTSTQILGLPAFGLNVDPSTITDFDGFVAYAVLAGSARDRDGNDYDVELDVRVMDGDYIGVDGKKHRGTYGFF